MQLSLTQGINGPQLRLVPARFFNPTVRHTEFGYGAFSVTYRCDYHEAFAIASKQNLFVRLLEDSVTVWQGRVQSIRFVAEGLMITALGAVQIVNDIIYTNMWSCIDYGRWLPDDLYPYGVSSQWNMDNNNRLFMAPKNGFTYSTDWFGAIYRFWPPYPTNRKIVGVMCDVEIALPNSDWKLELQAYDEPEYTNGLSVAVYPGSGITPQRGSICLTFAGRDWVMFHAVYRGGVPTTASSTDVFRAIVTNPRVVTDTSKMVNTTTSTAILGAGAQTINVASTANMIVGQKVVIGTFPSTNSETVTITAINPGVSFTASFFSANPSGVTVRGFTITPDLIASHIIPLYAGANPNQIANTNALVSTPAVDLQEAIYEGRRPADVLAELASIGDGVNQYEVGATRENMIYFRPRFSAAATYFATLTAQQIEMLLDQMYNMIQATYNDAERGIARAPFQTDTISVQRYGIYRQQVITVGGPSLQLANKMITAALNDYKEAAIRTQITIQQLFTPAGLQVSPLYLRNGDKLVIRSLPLGTPGYLDTILRNVRVADVLYKPDTDTVEITTVIPIPRVDFLLANSRRKLVTE